MARLDSFFDAIPPTRDADYAYRMGMDRMMAALTDEDVEFERNPARYLAECLRMEALLASVAEHEPHPVARVAGFYDSGTPTLEWIGQVAHGDVLYRTDGEGEV